MIMLRAFSGFGAISRLPMGIFRILGNLEMGQGRFQDSEYWWASLHFYIG